MPVTDVSVRAGDPAQQADGSWRGTAIYTFDDAQVVERTFSAVDEGTWHTTKDGMVPDVEEKLQWQNADEAIAIDYDIRLGAYKQAGQRKIGLTYLRAAMDIEDPLQAYYKFKYFDDYRVDEGWTVNEVYLQLLPVGLQDDEWQDMKTRYIYLSDPGRVTTMLDYETLIAGDVWVNPT